MSQVKLILSLDKDKLARVIDLILPFAHSFSVHRPLSQEPAANPIPTIIPPNAQQPLAKPQAPARAKRVYPRRKATVDSPIGWVILKKIWEGPTRYMELKDSLVAAGYSPESVGKYLRNLQEDGTVVDIIDNGYKKYIVTQQARQALMLKFPVDLP